ncbi:hypothetical protein [Vibrio vulnificus YJ016]|uniref:Uncharacterized protein n=1 Tax=Vibrio vulnificus (strain YJ016) TaxID=196600 RepID=Q7MDZ7_VIBVY|nr:hypothetical protein [Vibrio vulnificus YJ016]
MKRSSATFCGLKGATFTPLRANTRQRPATNTLFPASEVVPCTMSVVTFASIFYRRYSREVYFSLF